MKSGQLAAASSVLRALCAGVFVCILPKKAVPEMTYTMSGGTLNPTHSLTHWHADLLEDESGGQPAIVLEER